MDAANALRGKGLEYGFERGRCLPDVEFVTIEGFRKRLSDFKGRDNLLVILTGEDGDRLPAAMATEDADIKSHDGHVIAVLPGTSPEALRWPFDVVADPGGTVRRKFCSGDSDEPYLTVFITDRWGEVVFACRTGRGDPAPGVADLLDWLRFVDQQCPECFPPEWPA
jgi:hypothetical protein